MLSLLPARPALFARSAAMSRAVDAAAPGRPSAASKMKTAAANDQSQQRIVFKSSLTLSGPFYGPVNITVSGPKSDSPNGPQANPAPVVGEKRGRDGGDGADIDGSDDGSDEDSSGSELDAQGIDHHAHLFRDRGPRAVPSIAVCFSFILIRLRTWEKAPPCSQVDIYPRAKGCMRGYFQCKGFLPWCCH